MVSFGVYLQQTGGKEGIGPGLYTKFTIDRTHISLKSKSTSLGEFSHTMYSGSRQCITVLRLTACLELNCFR